MSGVSIYLPLDNYICHPYMKETSSKSQRINMGVLMRNEQYNDQMVYICQFYHRHVPMHDDSEESSRTKPVKILSGGDYLTFERHKSAQASMANGNTPSSRLEGLVPKMEEFHNQAELLKVIWNILYSTQSSRETGTLYAARNALDAKNVTNNPADDFYASAELLNKFSSAYIICGGIHHFGMTKLEDEPSENAYTGPIGSEIDMKNVVMKEAKAFLEKNVVFDVPQIPPYGIQNNLLVCRFCGKSYKKQKSLRKHEALSHNVDDPLFQDETQNVSNIQDTSLPESKDFVL
ncbi:uncharacterized protein LOC123541335 [Mercenaria mercenaria]|uniref:uncharacterized protein LOC123541335 n=1 Tax=Mercenaria mercenaria TaxID=6596 RepID=UPI00234EB207|nr:uncharacterized protein LOC123541335 [Mercenaria mercenaria]